MWLSNILCSLLFAFSWYEPAYGTVYKLGKQVMGVFHIEIVNRNYDMTYQNAKDGCSFYGAKLATYEQTKAAQEQAGYDSCSCGWHNEQRAYYPITTSLRKRCGGMTPGVRQCVWGKWNGYCYRSSKYYTIEKPVWGIAFVSVTGQRHRLSFDTVKTICESEGYEIATYDNLYNAWKLGYDKCRAGHLADGSVRYPIVRDLRSGCGGTTPGIRDVPSLRNNHAEGFCYTLKGKTTFSKAVKGVYRLSTGLYTYDYNTAYSECQNKFGHGLATQTDLSNAMKAGFDSCPCGWLLGKKMMYSITTSVGNKCGPKANNKGLHTCQGMKYADAYCKIPNEVIKPKGARHIGCYKDKLNVRDIGAEYVGWVDKVTPGACVAYCKNRNFKYAALQEGSVCFCGNRVGKYGKALQTECNKPCVGVPMITCGGDLRNDVYLTGAAPLKTSCSQRPCLPGQYCLYSKKDYFICTCPPGQRFESRYRKCIHIEKQDEHGLGCFKDHATLFDLEGKKVDLKYNNPEMCMEFCRDNKYLYAGLKDGKTCVCGNAYGRYGKADKKMCSKTCPGYSYYRCGAKLFTNVHKSGFKACTTKPCPSDRRCIDTDNGFWCSCKRGQVFNEYVQKCEDLYTGKANDYFTRAFNALRSGDFNEIIEFVDSANSIFNDIQHQCGETKNDESCQLLEVLSSMKLQAGMANQYSNRMRRMLYFEDAKLKNIDLGVYLNELQEKGIASRLLYDMSKGLNKIMEQNQENAKALGNYLNSVANYETAIAMSDKEELQGTAADLLEQSTALRTEILKDLEIIICAGFAAGGLEITTRIVSLAYEVINGIMGMIDVLPEFPNPNDIMDRTEQLTAAIVSVDELAALMGYMKDLAAYGAKLGENYKEQEKQVMAMDALVHYDDGSFGVEAKPISSEAVNNFIQNYGDLGPLVSMHDIEIYLGKLDAVAGEACDIFKSYESVAAKIIQGSRKDVFKACLYIAAKISGLGVLFEQIFDFQFELVDKYSAIIRGNVAMSYSQKLGTDVSKINLYQLIQGMILDQNQIQKVAMVLCNQKEYSNGGFRSEYCSKKYYSGDDIRKIISTTSSLTSHGVEASHFAFLPTTLIDKTNGINVTALLNGEEVEFTFPRQDRARLLKYKWIHFEDEFKSKVYYVKALEPYIPGLDCAEYITTSVRSGIKTSIYDSLSSTVYMVPPTQIISSQWSFNSLGHSKECASGMIYDFPIDLQGSKTERVCGHTKLSDNSKMYPGLFAERWLMKMRFETCTPAQIKQVASKLKTIPIRYTHLSIDLTNTYGDSGVPDFCYPNSCSNGGRCENDYEKMSFKCKCKSGTSGETCQKVEDKCAKIKCAGGTCVNRVGRQPYCDCGRFQTLDPELGRCMPSNCASGWLQCGKAKCVDTFNGPKCVCPPGHLYQSDTKSCLKDSCSAAVCGEAKCSNDKSGPTCSCGKNAAFDKETKTCKNACTLTSCPADATCKTVLTGYYRVPEKKCECLYGRIYWESIKSCAHDFCKRSGICGGAVCKNTVTGYECICPDKTKFNKDLKTCESQECNTLGKPPGCGNMLPSCINRGRQVCSSFRGGCWGNSRQFLCCNFCL